MTADTFKAQGSRLEVMELGRRRSVGEKARIVEEGLAELRQVSAPAGRHGIARSLLTNWRRTYSEGRRVRVIPSPAGWRSCWRAAAAWWWALTSTRVSMAAGVTDMRSGIDSLALQVQEHLSGDPHAEDLWVFRGRRSHHRNQRIPRS